MVRSAPALAWAAGCPMVNPGMGAAFSMDVASVDAHARHGRRDEVQRLETVEDAMSKVGKQVGEELKKGKSRPASSRSSLVVRRWSLARATTRLQSYDHNK
jgi:hypothetical protein